MLLNHLKTISFCRGIGQLIRQFRAATLPKNKYGENMGHYGTWTKNMGQLWDSKKIWDNYGTCIKNALKSTYILRK